MRETLPSRLSLVLSAHLPFACAHLIRCLNARPVIPPLFATAEDLRTTIYPCPVHELRPKTHLRARGQLLGRCTCSTVQSGICHRCSARNTDGRVIRSSQENELVQVECPEEGTQPHNQNIHQAVADVISHLACHPSSLSHDASALSVVIKSDPSDACKDPVYQLHA